MRGWYKRPMDLAILTLAHIALAPVWLALWTVIPLLIWREDRGPVFYGQPRAGRARAASSNAGAEATTFSYLKFRTMIVDADKVGPVWTTDDDPRVTRVGRFLRRTAMDELPGLLSIWRGDMSLVGPRALPLEEQRLLERQIPGFADRLRVTPGLTGLSQVYNPEDENNLKLELDRRYAETMSPWLDVKLIFLSVINTVLARWDTRSAKEDAPDP
jgi:lipopolysaccharide/colanic/teichoic acid biosynthesis glycosyltransferase